MDVAAADSELPVHDRRVVENEKLLPARRPVSLDQLERVAGKGFGELSRVCDGRRATDEPRLRAIKLADAAEAAQQICKMAPVDAAIIMQFVDYDIPQVLEKLCPSGVMGQDSGMEHVRIREDHVGALPDRFAGILRSVAIVGGR